MQSVWSNPVGSFPSISRVLQYPYDIHSPTATKVGEPLGATKNLTMTAQEEK